jgi:hypothetical protein
MRGVQYQHEARRVALGRDVALSNGVGGREHHRCGEAVSELMPWLSADAGKSQQLALSLLATRELSAEVHVVTPVQKPPSSEDHLPVVGWKSARSLIHGVNWKAWMLSAS